MDVAFRQMDPADLARVSQTCRQWEEYTHARRDDWKQELAENREETSVMG